MINRRELQGMQAAWRGQAQGTLLHALPLGSSRHQGCPEGPLSLLLSRKAIVGHCVSPPAGDEQSWCKRETCLCDKAVASCFASTLHSYNKSYLFYFKLKCQGSKLQC